jgi:hypothetical protein
MKAPIFVARCNRSRAVKTPFRVLICYDHEDDNTLSAITNSSEALDALDIKFCATAVHYS